MIRNEKRSANRQKGSVSLSTTTTNSVSLTLSLDEAQESTNRTHRRFSAYQWIGKIVLLSLRLFFGLPLKEVRKIITTNCCCRVRHFPINCMRIVMFSSYAR